MLVPDSRENEFLNVKYNPGTAEECRLPVEALVISKCNSS